MGTILDVVGIILALLFALFVWWLFARIQEDERARPKPSKRVVP
jgi:flagellar biogenesis protein FliO